MERMLDNLRKNGFWLFLLAIDLLLLAIPFTGLVSYSSTDDRKMLLFASGAYTGEPTPYLIFSNVIYGYIISSLYRFVDAVEWYAVVHYALHVICVDIFLVSIHKVSIRRWFKICCCLVIAVMSVYVAFGPQFTIISGELGLASIVVIWRKKPGLLRYVSALLLFFLGVIIRDQGALMPYLILLPLLIFPIRIKNRDYLEHIGVYALMFVTLVVVTVVDAKAYDNEEWRAFNEYSAVRSFIADNPRLAETKSLYTDSIQQMEYELLVDYRANDGHIMTAEDLKPSVDYLKSRLLSNIPYNFKGQYFSYNYNLRWMIFFLVLSVIVLWRDRPRRWKIWLIAGVTLMFLIANAYSMMMSVTRIRVIFVMSFVLLAGYGMVIAPSLPALRKSVVAYGFLLFFVAFGYLKVKETVDVYIGNKQSIALAAATTIPLIEQANSPKVLVQVGAPMSFDTFKYSKSILGQKIVRSSWTINSPHTTKYYNGLVSYIQGLPMIVNKDKIREVELMQDLLKNYYGNTTRCHVLAEAGNYQLIQLLSEGNIDVISNPN